MLLLPHTLAGITIVSKIQNPLVSLPLAFLSHFALDMIPHWDYFTRSSIKKIANNKHRKLIIRLVFLDFFLSLVIGGLFAHRALPDAGRALTFLAGAFLANLLDGLELPMMFGVRNKITEFVYSIQHPLQGRASPVLGILTQLVVVSTCLFFLLS